MSMTQISDKGGRFEIGSKGYEAKRKKKQEALKLGKCKACGMIACRIPHLTVFMHQ